MPPTTDYIRHAARLARKVQLDAALGGAPAPDAEFYKALAKALEEIAAGDGVISTVMSEQHRRPDVRWNFRAEPATPRTSP